MNHFNLKTLSQLFLISLIFHGGCLASQGKEKLEDEGSISTSIGNSSGRAPQSPLGQPPQDEDHRSSIRSANIQPEGVGKRRKIQDEEEEDEAALPQTIPLPAIGRVGFDAIPWTHSPYMGHTIYVTPEAEVVLPSRKYHRRHFKVHSPLTSIFKDLNNSIYFDKDNYGKSSNHLFVTLRIGFKQKGDADLSWGYFTLNADDAEQKFIFENINKKTQASYADFWNQTPKGWQKNPSIEVGDEKVKFVSESFKGFAGVVGSNSGHSEPAALGVLSSKKELFLEAIHQLPIGSKIKVFQIGLHSFLDFCGNCENMIQLFQNKFKIELFNFLKENPLKERYLFSSKLQKFNRVAFLINGFNNYPYRNKNYYFFEDKKEQQHQLEKIRYWNYFKNYRPFSGRLDFDSTRPLLLLVNLLKPTKGEGKVEVFPHANQAIIPFSYRNTSLSLTGGYLYTKVDDFISLITPELLELVWEKIIPI